MFGPVVLGTNRVDESQTSLLGEAECAWLKLRRWEDFRRESQCTNWLAANKALEIKLGNIYYMSLAVYNLAGSEICYGSVITVTYWPEKYMVRCSTDVYIIIYNTYNTWEVVWPIVLHVCGCSEGSCWSVCWQSCIICALYYHLSLH